VLSVGSHPFGATTMRDVNIVQNQINLSSVAKVPEVSAAIQSMTDPCPKNRPTAHMLLSHPMFWPAEQKLHFLLDLSDRLERDANKAAAAHTSSTLLMAIEEDSFNVVGHSWERRLDNDLLGDMVKYRRYNTSSVRDLLRVIRNKRHHYHDLDDRVRKRVGSIPSGFYIYFAVRFPRLLLHCYVVMCEWLPLEKQFAGYLQTTLSHHQGRFKAKVERLKEEATAAAAAAIATQEGQHNVAVKVNTTRVACNDTHLECSSAGIHRQAVKNPQAGSPMLSCETGSSITGKAATVWHPSASEWIASTSTMSFLHRRPLPLAGATAVSGSASSSSSAPPPREDRWRTKLCSHWVASSPEEGGPHCPYRTTGKCNFAHGPCELRPLEQQRRPGHLVDDPSGNIVAVYEAAKKAAELSATKVHKRPEKGRPSSHAKSSKCTPRS
jgi:hypothetical protein